MSIKVIDVRCTDGHTSEVFTKLDTEVPCPVCGKPTVRLLSAPRAMLEGISGTLPGASMAWERKREEKMRAEQKKLRDHGTYK